MGCTSPRTVGFAADGKTIVWSQKKRSKEYAAVQLPCSKCLQCRLDYARGWAIRCVHEAQMHNETSFITLTYDDQKLASKKLIYEDFQLFMKKLRKQRQNPIGYFVTGEYGEKTKRPHWHALLFGYRPRDAEYKYSNDRGDKCFSSKLLSTTWGNGIAEFGDVTIHSAGYCARYAAKKLVHGKDQDHDFHPISKKSSKHAIGKKWLEKYYADVFNEGVVRLRDGSTASIPRYYEKWLQKEMPELWLDYVTKTKIKNTERATVENSRALDEYWNEVHSKLLYQPLPFHPQKVRRLILESKFKILQDNLKL